MMDIDERIKRDAKIREATLRQLRKDWGPQFESNLRRIVDYLHEEYAGHGGFDAVFNLRRKGVKRGDDINFLKAALEMAKGAETVLSGMFVGDTLTIVQSSGVRRANGKLDRRIQLRVVAVE